jgi:nucleotide-binding universal stress UspA family protein
LRPAPSYRKTLGAEHRGAAPKKFHILGAVLDNDSSNLVVEEIRQLALIEDAEVTLLSVIEEQDDSHYRKYGLAIEGERFRSRLESYIQRFRRYNIDPTIRLIPGRAANTIVSLANKTGADIIVLGPSRKPGLFGSSVTKNVASLSLVKVVTAKSETSEFAWSIQGLALTSLTEHQVLDIDLFLVDIWYHHVSWLGDMALALLKDSHPTTDLDPHHCFVGKWLAELNTNPCWRPIAELIEPVHDDVHAMAEELTACANSNDLHCMKQLYKECLLPLSCSMRDQFTEASKLVRLRSGHHGCQQLPGLANHVCPIINEEMPCGGPLLQLHTIQYYLDSQGTANSGPDTLPENDQKSEKNKADK